MAIDTNSNDRFYKEAFVASTYYPSGGGGPLFAVTAFSNGQPDSSWGVYNGAANDGTFVVPSFGGGSDIPVAIAYDPNGGTGNPYLVIVGKSATGWAIAVLDTNLNTGISINYGNVVQDSMNSLESGQANAVWVDQTDGGGHFVAVGTDGSHMVAIGESSASLTAYTIGGSSWPGTYGIRTYSYASGTGTANSASANSVIELDDASNYQGTDNESLIIGGNTQWCNNTCTPTSGSDFTLVQINDSDGSVGPLGSIRTNIGQTLGSGHATNNPSYDVAESVVPFSSTGAGPLYLTAVGQSNALGSDHFTMVQYKPNTNHNGYVLVTTFGQYSDGVLTGPTGDAYAAIPDSFSSGTFEVLGASGSDFLVAKYTSSGSLDTSFGNAGLMYQDFGDTSGNNSNDVGYSLAMATDGSLLACGTTIQPGASHTQIALADLLDGNQLTVS